MIRSIQLIRDSNGLINDRGVNYGHGVFETLAFVPAQLDTRSALLLWDEHLQRLVFGANNLDIRCHPEELECLVVAEVDSVWQALPDVTSLIVKIVLTAGSAARGYGAYWSPVQREDTGRSCLMVSVSPFLESFVMPRKNGCSLMVCQHNLARQPQLAGFKHLNRLEQVLASREVMLAGASDGVMLDSMDRVVSTTCANIFWVEAGRLYTPKLTDCGIRGVFREKIMQSAVPALGLDCQEEAVAMDRLLVADEVFICNSLRGIWPVVSVHHNTFQIGDVTRALQVWMNPWTAK